MESTLGLAFLFPPPTPGTFGLAGGDRAAAGGASDRREALGVQWIDRNIVRGDEGQHLVAGPVEEWIELDQSAIHVGRDERHIATLRGLIGAQPRDPRSRAGKRAFEGLDLPYVTAGHAGLTRLIETVDSLAFNQRFETVMARINAADSPSIAAFHFRPEPVGLGKQSARVERHDFDIIIALGQ